MSVLNPSNRRMRDAQRAFHLLCAVLLAVYLYTPARDVPLVLLAVQIVVVPALVGSGLVMWQGPRLRRLLAHDRGPAVTAGHSAS